MTMPYSPGRALFEGNGTATDFPFSFKVWGTEQLTVTLTGPDGNSRPASGWTARLNDDVLETLDRIFARGVLHLRREDVEKFVFGHVKYLLLDFSACGLRRKQG